MEELGDEIDFEKTIGTMFEPGNCGLGCSIPLFVNTFYFPQKVDVQDADFKWSSALTPGWIEEDIEWFYLRVFSGDLTGARQWYEFPAFQVLGQKFENLTADKGRKGKRFRKYFVRQPEANIDKAFIEIPLPEKESSKKTLPEAEKEGDKGDDDEVEEEDEVPQLPQLILKDIFDIMSDVVPGLGKVFEQRMHRMLNQSLASETLEFE
jgi:hypothetical protein